MALIGVRRALIKPKKAVGGGGYIGAGDIKAFVNWYGLRAYNASYATGANPAVNLVDQAGANPITINILTNGSLDVVSISAWVAAHSVTVIKVAKLYDQVSTSHVAQVTLAVMPTLVLGVLGSLPVLRFSGSQSLGFASSGTVGQPFTVSAVVSRTGNFTTTGMFFGDSGNVGAGWANAANTLEFFSSSTTTVGSIADSSFHSIQMIGNGASGNIYIDGTSNVRNAGANGFNTAKILVGVDNFTEFFTGDLGEVGLSSSAFTVTGGGEASAINSNQRSYWGF